MFKWQEQYLTSERKKRVRYQSYHKNIKFISLNVSLKGSCFESKLGGVYKISFMD